MEAKEYVQKGINAALFDGADGKKIATEIVSLLAKEKLTIRAAKNVLRTAKQIIESKATLDSLL